jgi:hypothetical protein
VSTLYEKIEKYRLAGEGAGESSEPKSAPSNRDDAPQMGTPKAG